MLVQRSRSERFLLWTFIVAAHGACGSRPAAVSRVPEQDVPQNTASPSDRAESVELDGKREQCLALLEPSA
jgi:hypothetical protein